MTNWNDKMMSHAEFERLLDVYGSDRTRWPTDARASAAQLVARDKDAQRLLAEAEALDRALERAPLPSLAREAEVADRILVAARRSPRVVHATRDAGGGVQTSRLGQVIGFPRPRGWLTDRRAFGGAAGALAASLVLGVLLGLSGMAQNVAPAFEQLTGLALNEPFTAVAQVDLLDEDLL